MHKPGLRLAIALSVGLTATANATLLDNGIIKVGVDTMQYGGAITYLSRSDSNVNLINLYDQGRQIQQSYYAGDPIDRITEGQHPSWTPWTWNPIQAGDAWGDAAQVDEPVVSNGVIYTKTYPLLWDMNNETAEATIEQWTSLLGNTVHVRNKLTAARTDNLWTLRSLNQELPAVYTNSILCDQYTYVGDSPWTYDTLSELNYQADFNKDFPWMAWGPTVSGDATITGKLEQWAANVDATGWGIGVYYRNTEKFIGGLVGGCNGGSADVSTTYLSPLEMHAIDKNTVFEWEYDLVVGTLDEIRDFVYTDQFTHPWVFNWRYYVNQYPDLCSAGITTYEQAKNHWLHNGIREGRRAHPYFVASEYLALYADLRTAFGANNYHEAIRHYIRTGKDEGRQGAITILPTPSASCAAISGNVLSDPYIFDWRYYIHEYPDLCQAGLTTEQAATSHWLNNGIAEGRRGHSHVHSTQYLSRYSDLSTAFGTNYGQALSHYVNSGRNEGRIGTYAVRQPANTCPGVPAAWPTP